MKMLLDISMVEQLAPVLAFELDRIWVVEKLAADVRVSVLVVVESCVDLQIDPVLPLQYFTQGWAQIREGLEQSAHLDRLTGSEGAVTSCGGTWTELRSRKCRADGEVKISNAHSAPVLHGVANERLLLEQLRFDQSNVRDKDLGLQRSVCDGLGHSVALVAKTERSERQKRGQPKPFSLPMFFRLHAASLPLRGGAA